LGRRWGQIFGVKRSRDRAPLRGRGSPPWTCRARGLKGELTRFAQKFGIAALLDRGSRRFAELGLAAASRSDGRWLELLVAEPLLLRMPLVRFQQAHGGHRGAYLA
jgi:hypothetical protein